MFFQKYLKSTQKQRVLDETIVRQRREYTLYETIIRGSRQLEGLMCERLIRIRDFTQ